MCPMIQAEPCYTVCVIAIAIPRTVDSTLPEFVVVSKFYLVACFVRHSGVLS